MSNMCEIENASTASTASESELGENVYYVEKILDHKWTEDVSCNTQFIFSSCVGIA